MQIPEMSSGSPRLVDIPVKLVMVKGDRPQQDKVALHTGHASNQLWRSCTISSSEVMAIGHAFDVLTNQRRSALHTAIGKRIDDCNNRADAQKIRTQTGAAGGKVP